MNVLFVCLGNICRSPMAEGIMKKLYEQMLINGTIDSAGTADWNAGRSADWRAISIARENGIDISSHRARQVNVEDFQHFEIIFAMDRDNATALRKIAPRSLASKIRLLRADGDDVPDPYHGNETLFRSTFRLIESCLNDIVNEM